MVRCSGVDKLSVIDIELYYMSPAWIFVSSVLEFSVMRIIRYVR